MGQPSHSGRKQFVKRAVDKQQRRPSLGAPGQALQSGSPDPSDVNVPSAPQALHEAPRGLLGKSDG